MPHAAWPLVSDVTNALIALGFKTVTYDELGNETVACSIGEAIVTDALIASAVRILTTAIGSDPLLAEATPRAILHDPPGQRSKSYDTSSGGGRMLRLQRVCQSSTITSVVVTGQAQTLNVDYFLHGPDEYTAYIMEFRRPIFGLPQCISITATWGRWAQLPDEVFGAAITVACGLALQQAREGQKALPVRWQEGDVAEAYGELMLKTAGDGLIEQGKQVVGVYLNTSNFF